MLFMQKRNIKYKGLIRKPKLKKYICQYYGWISGYGDWDCDEFTIMAYDKKEAIEKANLRLRGSLIKGKPYVILESTYKLKQKAFEPIYLEQMKQINNQLNKSNE